MNLNPTDGTHWVLVILVIKRECDETAKQGQSPVYYFDGFVVETPPIIIKEYIDLGSDERKHEYDESYCGAYCLYIIYLIDKGFGIKNALNFLIIQVKYPKINDRCFSVSCNSDSHYRF